jgi:hypothetical protein
MDRRNLTGKRPGNAATVPVGHAGITYPTWPYVSKTSKPPARDAKAAESAAISGMMEQLPFDLGDGEVAHTIYHLADGEADTPGTALPF